METETGTSVLTSDHVWQTVPPLIVCLGTMGNILIVAVFVRSSMYKRTTTGLYMCALAISDLLGIYISLFPKWLTSISNDNLMYRDNFGCKVMPWLAYSVLAYSAWILVAMTVERVIGTYPSRASKGSCTNHGAKLYLLCLAFTLLAINSHILFGSVYIEATKDNPKPRHCGEKPDSYKHFFMYTWPWIDGSIYCFVPFAVICIGNAVILFQVRQSQRTMVRNRSVSLGSSFSNSSMPLARRRGRMTQLTFTLLLINTAFFVSTFPISVHFILIGIMPVSKTTHDLMFAVVFNFMFINNTFNVCLYSLSSTRFRQNMFAIFDKCITHISCTGSRQTARHGHVSNISDRNNRMKTRSTPMQNPASTNKNVYRVDSSVNS